MSASPASLMRRIYYVTILLALIAGGVYFAGTFRMGWAENLFLPENEISIPADFPSDVPVYDPAKITVTLYGFDYSVGPKAQRLNYRLDPGVTFNTVTTYYRQELKSKGWTTGEAQPGQGPTGTALVEFAAFTSEKADAKLYTHVSTQKDGITVRIEYTPKNMKAVAYDAEGAEIPEDFPSFLPLYSAAELFSYEVSADVGSNRHKAYFQIPGSEVSVADLKDFYTEWVVDEGWEKTKESSISKEYLAFSDGVRRLEIVIQPMSQHGSETPALYQVSMQAGSVSTVPIPEKRTMDGEKKEQDGSDPDEERFEPLNLPDFEDLPNGYGYAPAIKKLRTEGVLKGYPDGTFKPGNPVNRAEFVKTIVEALGDEASGDSCFSDVKEEWFSQYVCYAKEHDIIGGYPDGSFGPGRNVNYAEAVKIVMLAFGKMEEGDEEGWEWYDKYFNAAKERGYLELIESIAEDDPNTPISRGQMAQLIANLIGADTISMFPIGDDTVETSWEDNPSFPGCPKPTTPVAKSYVKIVSPNGNEKFAWGKAVPITIKTSPDIRAVRLSTTDTAGKKFDIAYMGVACDGSYEWNPAKDGRPLDAEMLPWSGTILAEGADAFPNYTVSDASDSSFTIVKP